MAQILQHRRATTTELGAERGSAGEFWMDENKNTLVVMDGSKLGGHPLAKFSDVPVNVSQLNNDAGYITQAAVFSGDYNDLSNLPVLVTDYSQLTGTPTLSTVAGTGEYSDLLNKPFIPTKVSDLPNDNSYANVTYVLNQISNGINNYDTGLQTQISGHIELTDISIGTNLAASADGTLSYDNTTGVISFVPPDLSEFMIALADDPSPQLFGNLITNNRQIVTTVGNIVLNPANNVDIQGGLSVSGAASIPYTDGTAAGTWSTSSPATISEAIDRIASAVYALSANTAI